MFSQKVEHWAESDDSGDVEFRRRITHGDICGCDSRHHRCLLSPNDVRSSSWNWRQYTDKFDRFTDYAVPDLNQLWTDNGYDVSQRSSSRKRRCRSCDRQRYCCCDCMCCNYRHGIPRRCDECWRTRDAPGYNDYLFQMAENPRSTVRIVPTTFVSSTAAASKATRFLDTRKQTYSENDNDREAYLTTYYGPFLARKIRIGDASQKIGIRSCRRVQESCSSERKYLREIQNDRPQYREIPVLEKVKSSEPAKQGTGSAAAARDHFTSLGKRTLSEFAEIPLTPVSIPRILIRADSSPSLKTVEPDVPKKLIRDTPGLQAHRRESGRDTLMEGLELLRYHKEEQERSKSILVKGKYGDVSDSDREIRAKKIPKIVAGSQDVAEKRRKFAVDESATYWSDKTREYRHELDEKRQETMKLSPDTTQTHYSLHETSAKPQTEAKKVAIDESKGSNSESKFIMEIRRAREGLRKVSKESDVIASYGGRQDTQKTSDFGGMFYNSNVYLSL
ncbi:unnamed protein product [Gongylonema pulchrum]|uniref:ARF7EP_C domain-containing protein n=1 Tax=Gongylonema pulchrum TaxID=637853 RepID=A0A183D8K0_9BILA|nr:unnamed protein product [Gongylonema pulchrum]